MTQRMEMPAIKPKKIWQPQPLDLSTWSKERTYSYKLSFDLFLLQEQFWKSYNLWVTCANKGSLIDQALARLLSDFCFTGPQSWPSDTWTNTHFFTAQGLIAGMTLFFFKIPGWENSVSKKGHCLFQLPPEDRVPVPCFPVLVRGGREE